MSNPIFNKFLTKDKALNSNVSRNLNVVSNSKNLDNQEVYADAIVMDSTEMTVNGAINKTLILFSLLFLSSPLGIRKRIL